MLWWGQLLYKEIAAISNGNKRCKNVPDFHKKFLENKKSLGHKLLKLEFYDRESLCTKIIADFTDETLSLENTTEHIVKTAFGKNEVPTWGDFQSFLEERCVPRSRSGIREYLDTIGVEEYTPIEIIKKTSGRMAEDNQWIKLEVIQ